jgi:hypothetical protein
MFEIGRKNVCLLMEKSTQIEGCIPAYFHWRLDKTDFTNQNI